MHGALRIGAIAVGLSITVAAATQFPSRDLQAQSSNSANAAMVHAGQDLFVQKCMQCHSVNEGQVTFGPNLYREMRKPQGKKSSAEIRELLKNGKGKMPPFKDKLSPQDTDNLLAYLRTL